MRVGARPRDQAGDWKHLKAECGSTSSARGSSPHPSGSHGGPRPGVGCESPRGLHPDPTAKPPPPKAGVGDAQWGARAARGRCWGAHDPPGARGRERAQPGRPGTFSSRSRSPAPPARRPLFLCGGDRISPRHRRHQAGPAGCAARARSPRRPLPAPPGAAPARGWAPRGDWRARRRPGREASRAGRPARGPSAGARRGRRGPPSFLPGRGPAGPPRPDPHGRPGLRAAKSQRRTQGPRVSAGAEVSTARQGAGAQGALPRGGGGGGGGRGRGRNGGGCGAERALGREVGVPGVIALCGVGGARGHRLAVWGAAGWGRRAPRMGVFGKIRTAGWGRLSAAWGREERSEAACGWGLCVRRGAECLPSVGWGPGGIHRAPGAGGELCARVRSGGGELTSPGGTGAWWGPPRGSRGRRGRRGPCVGQWGARGSPR